MRTLAAKNRDVPGNSQKALENGERRGPGANLEHQIVRERHLALVRQPRLEKTVRV